MVFPSPFQKNQFFVAIHNPVRKVFLLSFQSSSSQLGLWFSIWRSFDLCWTHLSTSRFFLIRYKRLLIVSCNVSKGFAKCCEGWGGSSPRDASSSFRSSLPELVLSFILRLLLRNCRACVLVVLIDGYSHCILLPLKMAFHSLFCWWKRNLNPFCRFSSCKSAEMITEWKIETLLSGRLDFCMFVCWRLVNKLVYLQNVAEHIIHWCRLLLEH